MLKHILRSRSRNLRFPFLVLLSVLPMIGICIYGSIQREPAEQFYNIAVFALLAFTSVITGIVTLATWGNNVAARIEELEEEIAKLKRLKE